jgi:hypothetical protein
MSEWLPVMLSKESYQASTLPGSAQRLLNMYPEILPEGAKGQMALLATPALSAFAEIGDGPIRGMRVMGAYAWVVSGEELYQVDRNGAAALIGTVSGSRDCYMTDNGTHVGIAADAHFYAANASGITEVNSERYSGATFQDGYGILAKEGTQEFYLTGLDDMTTVAALDFSTADAFPDSLVTCISHRRQLILLGETGTEIWDNTGNAAFPFERSGGGYIDRGCKAAGSVAKNEEVVTWLSNDLSVRALAGYQAQRISTPAIELLIKDVADPSSARGFTYSQGGHEFYALSFATLSLVYDFTTGRWHERQTFGDNRWRAHHHAALGGKQIVGDFETGELYELEPSTYSDDDMRVFTSSMLNGEGHRAIMDEVLLEAEAGVGETTGDDDPAVLLDWSDDGGKTWSNQRQARLGALGEYGTVVNWTRLGAFRQRILRFSMRANCKLAVTGCRARIELMA